MNKISMLLLLLFISACGKQYKPLHTPTQDQENARISALELIKYNYQLDLSNVGVYYDTDLRLPCGTENKIYGCFRQEYNAVYSISTVDIIYTCTILYHEYLHVVSHINNGDGDPEHKLMDYNSESIYDKCEAHLRMRGIVN